MAHEHPWIVESLSAHTLILPALRACTKKFLIFRCGQRAHRADATPHWPG